LVIAPHPDDESLGCGGTVAMLAAAGVDVDIAFVTRGERGTETNSSPDAQSAQQLAATRSDEAATATKLLGARRACFLSGRDGEVAQQPELQQEFAELIQHGAYQRVFVCWHGDRHPDHRAVFVWFLRALEQCPTVQSVWLYEVWSPLEPNTIVPIDGTIEVKRAAIAAHQSQLAVLDYSWAYLGLSAYRAILSPPSRYAEAFLVLTRDEVLQLGRQSA
jgi:LmbE family N-acetylglucosaminyl deacetylase